MTDQTFYCEHDQKTFSAPGKKLSWVDPAIGPCWKMVARCPDCGQQANELKVAMKAMKKNRSEAGAPPASCPTGTCPFAD